MFEALWLHLKCFLIYNYLKKFLRHQICKLYQNITTRLVFMIAFGIHCNFFIVLPIQLKPCRCNGFLLFTRQNERARKIGHISEVLCTWARPIGNGRTICPDLNMNQSVFTDKWSTFALIFLVSSYFSKKYGNNC